MKSNYIKPKNAFRKLQLADSMKQCIFINGVTGCGKTALIHHYFGKTKYSHLSCRNGSLQIEGEEKSPEHLERIIVVDDLQFLKKKEERDQVLAWIGQEEYWVILLSRGALPGWLKGVYLNQGMLLISEKELAWQEADVADYLGYFELGLTKEQSSEIYRMTQGNALAVLLCRKIIHDDGRYPSDLMLRAQRTLSDYLEHEVLSQWESGLLTFVMQMSLVEDFTVELAELITARKDVCRLIEEVLEIGSILIIDESGTYSIRRILRKILKRLAEREKGLDWCRDIYYNAGLYYEMHEKIAKALNFYEKSGNKNRIHELLVRNGRMHPGSGYFYELRKYYLALSEEELQEDAVLMAGVSMLYSLLLQPEQSEYWYNRLKEYEKKASGGHAREAKSLLSYLDIALPQRGSKGLITVFQSIPSLLFSKGISLQEFSVTSNLPSLMNGGKDFCEWSRRDKELAASIGKVITLVLGRYGKGLVNIAVAESQYEKCGDIYEILSLLSRGTLEAEAGGRIEILFAAVGIQVRLNMSHGNEKAAEDILASFEKKVTEENAVEVRRNLEAMQCRLALYDNNRPKIKTWMQNAPREDKEFYILDRYCYLTKVRCYLYLGEYYRALMLLEKLTYYAELYERYYIEMETKLLTALTKYRMQAEDWREMLYAAVEQAEDYDFCQLFIEEGAALWELLNEQTVRLTLKERCNKDYIKKLYQGTEQMAVCFPMYLSQGGLTPADFSNNARMVLRLQADGMTMKQIAAKMGIAEETARYHSKENYKKLKVSGKADAVLAARNLKLL